MAIPRVVMRPLRMESNSKFEGKEGRELRRAMGSIYH
jgi:hypothetical protein